MFKIAFLLFLVSFIAIADNFKIKYIPENTIHSDEKKRNIKDLSKDKHTIDAINDMRELMFIEIFNYEYLKKRPESMQIKDHIINNIIGYIGQHNRYMSWNIIYIENKDYTNDSTQTPNMLKDNSSIDDVINFMNNINKNDKIVGYLSYDIYTENNVIKSDLNNFYVKQKFKSLDVPKKLLKAYIEKLSKHGVQYVKWSCSEYTKLGSNPTYPIYRILPTYGFDIRKMKKLQSSIVKGTEFHYESIDFNDLKSLNIQ